VGYLPESVPLYGEMNVTEYLEFMGSLHRLEELDARVDEVLESVGLVDRAESLIGNLSKGMRQRVGLAQALLHQPQVLILDEPTIGLDPAQIIEVRRLIQDLRKDRTVLLSTHILSEAQQICDRVLIIHRGKIVAEDTPANLQAQLAGAERVRVFVRGERDPLVKVLEKLTGVTEITPLEDAGGVELASAPGSDMRPEIARAVVGADLDLLEMVPVGFSLEDIFLQLTREEERVQQEERIAELDSEIGPDDLQDEER
jgi:ABC-2 type transport system ATP-binding protein